MFIKTNKILNTGLLCLFVSLLHGVLYAQNPATINSVLEGTVTDETTGLPLEGANIIIEGVTNQTTTNAKGQFILRTGQKFPYNIIITFVGYEKQVVVANGSPVAVRLKPTGSNLDDVVVVGYGTQKRKDFTGSLASVPSTLKEQLTSSPERLLQGSVTGVQVTQANGQPGASVSIRIRGGTSINAGNEPLYVIDGLPVYNSDETVNAGVSNGTSINPLALINPSDIESIDVLKDASATAIYGSRGANGVVIITTKNGSRGGYQIEYNGSYGVQQVSKTIDMLNGRQWGELKNDALQGAGKSPLYTRAQLDSLGVGTDWQAAVFRKASIQNHSVSLSAGNERSRILLSGSYLNQDGIIINTGFERYSLRLNTDYNLSEKFKVGANVSYGYTKAVLAPGNIVYNTLAMVPVVPVRDGEGNFTESSAFGSTISNPIATLTLQTNSTNTGRLLTNTFAEYSLFKGLTIRSSFGTDIINNKQNYYLPSELYESAVGGRASVGSLSTINWINENTLNYKTTFNRAHNLEVLVGNTQQKSATEIFAANASNFVTDAYTYNNLGAASVFLAPASNKIEWALKSYLARANYGYDNRYLLTLTARADGSSRFGKNNKWGTFPSAAFAWNIGNEKFFEDINSISALKLRASAGVTGNQEIEAYRSLARLSNYQYSFANTVVNGLATSSFANPDLTWEKTSQYNLGIDVEFFSGRIQLTTDLYYKRTSDLLLEVPVPYSSSLVSAFQNLGIVRNKGLEINARTINTNGAFKWASNILFSLNRNKILSLGGDADYFFITDPGAPTLLPTQIIKVGESVGAFYMYQADGVNPETGLQKYKDQNDDGNITADYDRVIAGSSQPKFLASLLNTFSYKGFDLSIFLNASYGNRVFNWTRANLELGTGYTGAVATLLDRWTPINTITNMHKAIENPSVTISDRFLEDASFLRVKNITLGYSIPQSVLSKIRFKSTRVFVQANNLTTWTKYTGYDPEVNTNEQNSLSTGIDRSAYPNAQSFVAGLNIKF
ncbi:SusC/RagA family TonB-linked outer membrane protein [Niabella aquatica]